MLLAQLFQLKPNLSPHWEKPLPGPLTAVVVAQGRLYVAQRETHTVHALNAEDGSPLWHFAAGGRVDSPPTIHDGQVYFGSADGCIYCLRATDGALVWRFRVAPESRQIVSYDQLESVWPVHGNVLVCRDPKRPARAVAYAVAGRTSYIDGGLFFCGVDAVAGELLVERRISHRDPSTGLEPQETVRGVEMPGALPDVLASDGDFGFATESCVADDSRFLSLVDNESATEDEATWFLIRPVFSTGPGTYDSDGPGQHAPRDLGIGPTCP